MIDGLLSHGTNVSGIPFSAYPVDFHAYLETAYPTGADVALGAVRPLVAQDVAWIFQPYWQWCWPWEVPPSTSSLN